MQVVGVPDERMGEELCAWVVLRAGATADEESIREHCRGRIAHYKVPRYVLFVDAFPMTVTGKIQKYLMRETSIERLGLEAARRRDPEHVLERRGRTAAAWGLPPRDQEKV